MWEQKAVILSHKVYTTKVADLGHSGASCWIQSTHGFLSRLEEHFLMF